VSKPAKQLGDLVGLPLMFLTRETFVCHFFGPLILPMCIATSYELSDPSNVWEPLVLP